MALRGTHRAYLWLLSLPVALVVPRDRGSLVSRHPPLQSPIGPGGPIGPYLPGGPSEPVLPGGPSFPRFPGLPRLPLLPFGPAWQSV